MSDRSQAPGVYVNRERGHPRPAPPIFLDRTGPRARLVVRITGQIPGPDDYESAFADSICTESHPRWYKVHEQFLKGKIQLEQRIRGHSNWRHTHVVGYIGKMEESDWVWALLCKIPNGGWRVWRWHYMTRPEFDELLKHDDWCVSMTWPRGRWIRWAEIRDNQDWDAYRQLESSDALEFVSTGRFQEFPERIQDWIREAAWSIIGRFYDVGQLLNFIVNRIWGLKRSRWLRITDFGKTNRVCSSAWGYCLEYGREKGRQVTGHWPWPRPFRAQDGRPVHLEAYMPADFANDPQLAHVGRGGWPPKPKPEPEAVGEVVMVEPEESLRPDGVPPSIESTEILAARTVAQVKEARQAAHVQYLERLLNSRLLYKPERDRIKMAIASGGSEYLSALVKHYREVTSQRIKAAKNTTRRQRRAHHKGERPHRVRLRGWSNKPG